MATIVTSTGERLLTIEEYAQLPDNGTPTELVRGRVVILNMPFPYQTFPDVLPGFSATVKRFFE